ncbi:MAG: putative hydroxymethylpyrimidine transport system substrate-binding protein [Solirubrobacteraceae bacterium]|jgi:ABC-type nitrate/sulfonate/bicarbonate transport system substrate-binding protein|nr:putative hydroxymethylpyrimidine transport system substrate-binding protein [Solirubrobacteraceae bacterium]
MRRARCALAALLLAAAAFSVAGCGAAGEDVAPNRDATLLLDFQPNAVHTGIYMAVARGYDEALGVNLRIRAPTASTDAVKLLASGRADLAVLDIHDLAIARERGRDLVGVMALVQEPLAAVLAQPSISTPRDLEGHRAGVTGLPSDDAVLSSIVAGAGGDPARVRRTTIGFDAVRSLLSHRVAAATGFWNVEGVALRARRPGMREFRVGDYGAPEYPELVLATTRATLQDEPGLVRGAVQALARGYAEVLSDPESAVSTLLSAVRGLDRADVARELDAVSAAFTSGARSFGELDPGRLRAWARWERRFGIVKRLPDVAKAFDGRYVPRSGSRD